MKIGFFSHKNHNFILKPIYPYFPPEGRDFTESVKQASSEIWSFQRSSNLCLFSYSLLTKLIDPLGCLQSNCFNFQDQSPKIVHLRSCSNFCGDHWATTTRATNNTWYPIQMHTVNFRFPLSVIESIKLWTSFSVFNNTNSNNNNNSNPQQQHQQQQLHFYGIKQTLRANVFEHFWSFIEL